MNAPVKETAGRDTKWNFANSRGSHISLDEFLKQKEAGGVNFFDGKEPWLGGVQKLTWQTFFRVCTEEMDDLSMKATKLVIEYCLEIVEEIQQKISGRPTLARLENALSAQYTEQYENKVYQYRWALRHPVVSEAVANALHNRFRTLV